MATLPASRLSWSLILHHCPSNCHQHPLQSFAGVASGSFAAPDHEYPSHLELRLTAVDSGGLQQSTSVLLQPRTVVLSFRTSPVPLQITFDGTAPEDAVRSDGDRRIAAFDQRPVAAEAGLEQYDFVSWSDGGASDPRHRRRPDGRGVDRGVSESRTVACTSIGSRRFDLMRFEFRKHKEGV